MGFWDIYGFLELMLLPSSLSSLIQEFPLFLPSNHTFWHSFSVLHPWSANCTYRFFFTSSVSSPCISLNCTTFFPCQAYYTLMSLCPGIFYFKRTCLFGAKCYTTSLTFFWQLNKKCITKLKAQFCKKINPIT